MSEPKIKTFGEYMDRFFPDASPVDRAAREAAVILSRLPTAHDQAVALSEVRAILRNASAYHSQRDGE